MVSRWNQGLVAGRAYGVALRGGFVAELPINPYPERSNSWGLWKNGFEVALQRLGLNPARNP
jgi:hypothetical protein